ncbi:hypothetical protein E6W17_22285 [Streptomyces sp. A1547]|nr:hypothetical protein E6W17_22285 [Streptomyces sp. A1547]
MVRSADAQIRITIRSPRCGDLMRVRTFVLN